jgi:aldehyde:ferredoxin oxidoreductase
VDGPVFKLIKIQNVLTQINKIYPAIAKEILSGNGSAPPADTPQKKEEPSKSGLQSAYRDGDQAWRLIDTFLTKVNEDEDSKKMIPRSTPVTIQYVMPDIDFKYVEHIGEGAVKYERGETAKPDVTLTMDSRTYHEIMAGEIHPVQASEAKRSKIDGPVFKLIKIQNVLTQINKIYPAIAEEELSSDDSEPPPAAPEKKEEGEVVKKTIELSQENKIVFIDLATRDVRFETLQPRVKELFLGGRGVNAYLAYKYIKPGIDPHSGESPLFVSPGLLTGASGLASSRCSIAGKSPETGFYGEANIGGHFPALMKRHGFDHLIITGKAETPVSIVIEEDSVKVIDAAQHWGKDTFEFQDDLAEEFGKGSHCLCIGQAGENLVKFACVRSGRKSAAGRTGLGCLMGAKKLKAIIALPSKTRVAPANPEEYREYCKELVKIMKDEPMVGRFLEFGTPWLYDLVNEGVKVGRTYNGLTNEFKAIENIGPNQLLDFTNGRRGCYSCQFACRHVYEVKEGKYAGVTGEGPECGVMANFGPMLGITRLEPILAANDLINKYGIDSSTMGNMVAWAMELYHREIITTEDTGGMKLEWGDDDVLLELIEKVTFREGFGDVLAEGAKGASDIIGRDSARYLSTVKNLPQSCATDMRFFRAFGLGLATSTRGADHLRSRPFYEPLEYPAEELKEIYGTDVDSAADSYKGKGRVVQWWEAYMSLFDVLGICKLIGLSNLPGVFMFPEFGKLLELGVGIRREDEEMFVLGDRTTTMERLFIAREGIRRKDDILPERFYKPLEWENSAPEKIVDYDKFQQILTEYYQWHGWDTETGIPTMECLERLGIAELFDESELEVKDS